MLKSKYIITYLDKAGQNIAFICKVLYHNLISSVLLSSGDTYKSVTDNVSVILSKLRADILVLDLPKSSFISILPYIFLIVKAHKISIKFRTIVASNGSYIEPLGRLVACALEEVSTLWLRYTHNTIQGGIISTRVMIENHQSVLDTLESLNEKEQVVSVDTFDFSDMYTALRHDIVFDAIVQILYINVSNKGQLWLKSNSKIRILITLLSKNYELA